MKILHTSDWHLGASLGQEKRYEEFEKTLDWLTDTVKKENIRTIIIAGDIFDSSLPSNRAAGLYYDFLACVLASGVKHVIAAAGNHDSASFLESPGNILKHLHIHAVGKADRNAPEKAVIPLTEDDGTVSAVICAVPHLRERDIRTSSGGETVADRNSARQQAVLQYYEQVCSAAEKLYPGVPVIATGHFYAEESGAFDSVLDIPVNSLPDNISYLALGHLHTGQSIAGKDHFRYSGSLLQMNFSDQAQEKSVLVLDTANLNDTPVKIPVPVFQKILKISGNTDELYTALDGLKLQGHSVWIHCENTGPFEVNLMQKLSAYCEGSEVKVLSCSNTHANPAVLKRRPKGENLKNLSPRDVFLNLLDDFPEEHRQKLIRYFDEAVLDITGENNDLG